MFYVQLDKLGQIPERVGVGLDRYLIHVLTGGHVVDLLVSIVIRIPDDVRGLGLIIELGHRMVGKTEKALDQGQGIK